MEIVPHFCVLKIAYGSLSSVLVLFYFLHYTIWGLIAVFLATADGNLLIFQPFLKMHFKYAFSSYKCSWFSCISLFFFSPGLLLLLKKKKKKFIYLAVLGLSCSMGDLVLWPGIEPRPPALGARSLNHWGTREVPVSQILMLHFHYHSFISAYFLISIVISSVTGY